jgi:hypothetical protein
LSTPESGGHDLAKVGDKTMNTSNIFCFIKFAALLSFAAALAASGASADDSASNKNLATLYPSVTIAYEQCPGHATIAQVDYDRISGLATHLAASDAASAKAGNDVAHMGYLPDPDQFCKIMQSKAKALSSIH